MHELDKFLEHSGVKGMHWGVRNDTRARNKRYNSYNKGLKIVDRHRLKKMTDVKDRTKYLDDKDTKWLSKVKDDKHLNKVSKRTAREMKKVNKELKKEYGGTGLKGNAKRAMNGRMNAEYMKQMKTSYEEVLKDHAYSVYKLSPSRTREVEIHPQSDGTMKAVIVERINPTLTKQRNSINKAVNKAIRQEAKNKELIKHSDSEDASTNLDGMFFLIKMDDDGFPDEVISPFDSEEDTVEHSGVKGMKWGVRHDDRPAKGPERGRLGKEWDSRKRERQWKQAIKDIHTMSTKDIGIVKKRIDLENDLKILSKSPMATKKDKADYLRRHEMSNEELTRKTTRLKAMNALYKSVNDASKEQREFGHKVAQTASSVAYKLATKHKLGPQDLIDLYTNPIIKTKQNALDKSLDLADSKVTNPKVKNAISLARNIKFKEDGKLEVSSNNKSKDKSKG